MSIFNILIGQRKLLKVSQKEMAKHLNCTPSTLNRYEKGNRKITAEDQEKYADKLGYELKLMIK